MVWSKKSKCLCMEIHCPGRLKYQKLSVLTVADYIAGSNVSLIPPWVNLGRLH